ncbi:MAG: UPF0175 family protein [Candidatus Sumerlaeaceae bacterium]
MSLMIPDEVLEAAHMTPEEMRCEIAVMLFSGEKLTLAQAARLAGLDRLSFQQILASRNITLHYGAEEFHEDLQALRDLTHG